MKTLIVYSSKYGTSERYAGWLAQDLGCEALDAKQVGQEAMREADTLVLCGGLYASGMAGLSWLKKNRPVWEGKKVALFAVGASPPDEKAIEEVRRHNLKDGLEDLPFFYGRGRWDEAGMGPAHRILARILKKSVLKKAPEQREPWEEALVEASRQEGAADWSDPAYLEPLKSFLKGEE